MKFLYNIGLTFILLNCYKATYSKSKDTTQIISVDADIIALDESIHLKFPNAKTDEYFIVVTLTNTQDTTISIRIMTCSWSESFTFGKDSLYLTYPGCDSNFPITVEILPHKTVKFFGKLGYYGKKRDYRNPLSFKIGFIDLPYKDFFDFPYSKKDKMKYKTYWSDNIILRSKLHHYEKEKLFVNH